MTRRWAWFVPVKVIEHDFMNLRLKSEDVAEFAYTPVPCKKTYRRMTRST